MKDEQITKIGDKIIFTIKSTQTNEIYVQHVLSRLNMKVISKVVKM